MNQQNFEEARQSEMSYHSQFYEENDLFESGTWMSGPGPVVLDMLDRLMQHKRDLKVLDLGSGVGRNTIPVATRLTDSNSSITAVDLLDNAINKLKEYARKYQVEHLIKAEAADVEHYAIPEGSYDYILACSCLEHTSSEEALRTVLHRMQKATQLGGIHVITMSTDVQEVEEETGNIREGLIELNLSSEQALEMLHDTYEGWNVLVEKTVPQSIDEEKEGVAIKFQCTLITYVVQRVQE